MLIQKKPDIVPSEITPREVFNNRREFIKLAGAGFTTYNNYYEFGTGKSDPALQSRLFNPYPWTVSIEGEVKKAKRVSIEDIFKITHLEERIYRMRCVEAWSMVIPWVGLPLAQLIKWAEPTANAKYVEFISMADPQSMPGVRVPGLTGWLSSRT